MNQESVANFVGTVITDEALTALRERNARRLEEAKLALGTKWILHPDNATVRKTIDLKDTKK